MEDKGKSKKENAISMLMPLIIEYLAEDTSEEADKMMTEFLSSKTGQLLYDDESELWQSGPAYIAELFKKELNR